MVGLFARGRDPRYVRERARLNVREEFLLRANHVLPIGTVAPAFDRLISRPIPAHRRVHRAGIKAPCEAAVVEFVTQRLGIETGRLRRAEGAIAFQRLDGIARATIASPKRAEGNVDARSGLTGDDVLMRNETFVDLRRMKVLAEYPLVRHVPIRFRLVVRNVCVLRIWRSPKRLFLIESIHTAMRAR